MNFFSYQSQNYANKLTATVWDKVIAGLSIWAENHENRLSVHANSSGYPNLTPSDLSFDDLLSTKNNNMLTSEMRNRLLTKLTNIITNHEMRLRAINMPTIGQCL